MLLIEYPKCSTCKKAEKYLCSKKINYDSRNIVENRLNVKELENEISKEYGDLNTSFNIDIDKLKSTSTDINVPLIQPINPVSNTNVGPINLGEKRQNKFFNDLEDEQANMSTDETANPFQNSYMSFESDKESIDSLDFLPPN